MKHRIVNEVMEAENKAMLPKLETHFEDVLTNKTSEDYSSKYHFHDKIKVTKTHANSNTINKKIKTKTKNKKSDSNKTYLMN